MALFLPELIQAIYLIFFQQFTSAITGQRLAQSTLNTLMRPRVHAPVWWLQ
jgi:hypothetical protein